MKLSRRLGMAAVAVAVVAVMLLIGFLPRSVPVEIAPVTRGTLRVTVDEDGRTRIK